jgi:hypothetical protein
MPLARAVFDRRGTAQNRSGQVLTAAQLERGNPDTRRATLGCMTVMTTSDHEFLTMAEVAELLLCSEPTVRPKVPLRAPFSASSLGKGR